MRLAVLASGSGTILDAMARRGLPISLVMVDRACGAEKVAADHGLMCVLVERDSFGADFDRVGYTRRVTERLQAEGIELVAMAGFGTVLDQPMQDAYGGRILNTHPSLLPAFPGWHAVEDALEYGVKVTGCTVHVATLEVDAGPILAQHPVAVELDDTVDTLHERIKTVERDLYIRTIQEIINRGHVL
ncbi:MAG: phosphoribosylglycinamide formyltransferase [bacterium]|nr:phosphoribosylglycinamide formyltransferase [bacterium]